MSDPSGQVGPASTRLIVIRGSSGSGKSTVAAAVREARPERSGAVIGQDVMRRQVLGTGDDFGGHATALIDLTTRFALDRALMLLSKASSMPTGTRRHCFD